MPTERGTFYFSWLLIMERKIHLRPAVPADIPVLRELIDASVRGLQAHDYTPAQIEGALKTVFGVDSQLIADGTYIVAEATPDEIARAGEDNTNADPVIVGCGGWSKRKTLYGSDRWTGREDALLDPLRDAAKIRAFFIHPAWARCGIGSMILEACEVAARAAGFTRFEMGATLTGAKLFGVKGYVAVKPIEIPLANGESLPVLHMEKHAR
jgi:GNAT superfamily N-acetyltransferase